MRIHRAVDIDALAHQIAGKNLAPGVDPWFGRIRALSKAVSLLENDPWLATSLLQHPALVDVATETRVVGLTGLPGAGKSTLTGLIVGELRRRGHKVAVLAVDPSSAENMGALLGDRIRMQEHFSDPDVFIRSMGSRGALGGVARATRGAIRLIGLLGFHYVLVETVGVGQSECEIVSIADTTALVMMPNSGDDIQLMKSGVFQMADVYVVNKCDLADPERMMAELRANNPKTDEDSWTPAVLATSAMEHVGISHLVAALEEHAQYEREHPRGQAQRRKRVLGEVKANMLALVEREAEALVAAIEDFEVRQLECGQKPAMVTASRLVDELLGRSRQPT
jgi:LAO/AO transport system kinase